MQLTGHITPDSLMSLEAYSKWRKVHKGEVIAHRKLRSVQLGEHLNLQFESETTIRYQIQEMLRIEKIFEEEGIQQEIEAYAPLVPDGHNWKATMMIEYPDVNERKRELARLIGVEAAGAMVELRMDMDVIVAISTAPHPLDPPRRADYRRHAARPAQCDLQRQGPAGHGTLRLTRDGRAPLL